MKKVLGAAVLILMLAGCADLSPHYVRPDPLLPTRVVASDEGKFSAAFASIVKDERVSAVIAAANTHNQDFSVSALNVERARALYGVQRAQSLPAISGGVNGAKSSKDAEIRTSLSVAMASYEIDFWGRVRNLDRSVLQSYLQAEQSRESALLTVSAEATVAWLTLAADQRRGVVGLRNVETLDRLRQIATARYREGATGRLEPSQADSAVSQARLDLVTRSAQVDRDLAALDLVVGAGVPEALLPAAAEDPLDAVALNTSAPSEVPSELLLRRPDVQAAEHALQAAYANVGVARAERFPRVAISADLSRSGTGLSGLSAQTASSTVASIAAPLIDFGALRGRGRAAEIDRQIALAQYQRTLQVAFKETADAISQSEEAAASVEAGIEFLEAAVLERSIAEQRYAAGRVGLSTLLDAQRQVLSAEDRLISARLIRAVSAVTLMRVLAGGWEAVPKGDYE